jgi:hypothetical protein
MYGFVFIVYFKINKSLQIWLLLSFVRNYFMCLLSLCFGQPLVSLWSAFGQPLVSLWSAFGQPLVSLWSAAREAINTH